MRGTLVDLTGARFGRWTAIARSGTAPSGATLWLARCDCGTERSVPQADLRRGKSVSCGCASAAGPRGRTWSEADENALRAAWASADRFERIPIAELIQALRRSKVAIWRKARELGLTNPRRPKRPARPVKTKEQIDADRSALARRRIAENGHPRGMAGKRHSDATRARLREKSTARWDAMTEEQKQEAIMARVRTRRAKPVPFNGNRPHGSWKAGWREVGGQRVYFRSRWEANYARYLEWLRVNGEIEKWEHEPHTFWFTGVKRGCVSYLPDFRVTRSSGGIEWHEVKGWMDARSKTVLKRMAKYHPREKLIVIDGKFYRAMCRQVAALVPGWES
jgi:hypothetical protein